MKETENCLAHRSLQFNGAISSEDLHTSLNGILLDRTQVHLRHLVPQDVSDIFVVILSLGEVDLSHN